MALQDSIKYNGRPAVKNRTVGRGKAALGARKMRKRAGALLRGFVSKQFEDKRRREARRKLRQGELKEGWEY